MIRVSFAFPPNGSRLQWMCYEHGPACELSKKMNLSILHYLALKALVARIVDEASSPDPNARRLDGEWREALVRTLNLIERDEEK